VVELESSKTSGSAFQHSGVTRPTPCCARCHASCATGTEYDFSLIVEIPENACYTISRNRPGRAAVRDAGEVALDDCAGHTY